MAETTKRKTYTSTQVKQRYNQKVYSRLQISLPKDLVVRFKAKCETDGIPQAQVIKKAVVDFLDEN